VTNGAEVKTLRDMILTVRDRVQHLMDNGQTERQVLAEHPAAEFDMRWGQGRVTPGAFVHEIYIALTAPKS